MFTFRILAIAVVIGLTTIPATADDWPGWLGPDRTSEWREEGVKTAFDEGELKQRWRADCSYGYAGPAVAGGRVYLFDYEIAEGKIQNNPSQPIKLSGNERLHCLDAKTGEQLWTKSQAVNYYVSYPGGPRATPTVNGQYVYTLGVEGDLTCRNTSDGETVWHVNFLDKYGIKTPIWGHSSCPLVVGDLLYVMVGGEGSAVVAFDKATGTEAWKALSSDEPGYCSPIVTKLAGADRLVAFHPAGVSALDLKTGEELWTKAIKSNYGMSIALPRVNDNRMFVSGYGASMMLSELGEPVPTVALRGKPNVSVECSNSTPYFASDAVYGCDANSSALMGIDPNDGARLWKNRDLVVGPDAGRNTRHGTVFIVRHTPSGRYFLFNELGQLIVADLTREGVTEHGTAKLLEPTGEAFGRSVVWTHPAFAEKCVFVRNDKEICCYSLAVE